MNVNRLVQHARRWGHESIFAAAVDEIDGSELARLAAILRRLGWRPPKAEQERIEQARATASANGSGSVRLGILEMDATSGCRPLGPHDERALSVTDAA